MKRRILPYSFLSLTLLFVLLSGESDLLAQSTGTATGIPTFHCIGLYWSGSGGNANTVCNVQYRVAGSGSAWKTGYPLWFDSRAIGGRPANEYRGSLVNLTPGTTYEILLVAGSATNSITVSTWNENFPEGVSTTLTAPTTISTSGSANAYRVYTGAINGGTNNIVVNASYIIIRNMTLTNASQDAIVIGQNAHHVVIEGCDISGWGQIGMDSDNQGAVRIKGFSYNATNVKQVVVQRNKIHDSRENSNSWDNGGHPLGPNGITFDESGGNHVIRYNEIYASSPSRKFMDGIGGGDNFTFTGAPGANSDIYGNKVENVYDDAIESEGGNCNVRIWGNWINNTFTGIATAANSIGPMYIWNNVSNLSIRSQDGASASTMDNEDRGPFNKCGSPNATYSGGRTYLFHNTILQPVQSGYTYPRGMGGGPVDNGGALRNAISRNNIWQTYRSNHPAIGEFSSPSNSGNSYDYDLYNSNLQIAASGTHESHGIKATPVYASTVPITGPNPAGYFLASNSPGVDDGVVLSNFNDDYTGTGPDMGAYEIGKPALQFGVNAYVNNSPVTANAGADISITLPTNTATLNGSGSTQTGSITTYAWAYLSGPSNYSIGNPASASTTISGLVQGTYVFKLTVTNSAGQTASDNVSVIVNAVPNQAPTANAGQDVSITLPISITSLTGTGSDADGTIVNYAWTKVSGPASFTLGTPNSPTTTLINLVAGTYIFRLTVTDDDGATGTDNVTVTVNPLINQAPSANAGPDMVLTLPTNFTTLNGSGSDPDGLISTYAWSRVSGPASFTFGSAGAAATSVSNLVQGTYVFRLTVTDNNGATGTDNVTVTVNAAPPVNQPPIARAGTDISITLPVNSTTLNGNSSSDPDGTIVSYAWSKISGPATFNLASPNAATTALNNLGEGIYVFRLTVTDNSGATGTDNITVTVNAAPPPNQAPVANAGTDISITLPVNSTNLNGTSSYDPDGAIVSYAWSKLSGPTTFTLASPNAVTTALNNLGQGTYVFRLTVTDNIGATATDNITVTVNPAPPVNQPPVARAGTDIVLNLPTNSTSLNASASTDADGTIVSYIWSRVSGPNSHMIGSPNAVTTSLTNLVQGNYVFRLTVIDNDGASAIDDINVKVNPPANQAPFANAGADIILTLPVNSTTLTGSGNDPDGSISSFTWTRVSGPTPFTMGNSNAASTSLTNLVQGVYIFRLTVKDNSGATGSDDMIVVVNAANPAPNQSPSADAGNDLVLTLPANATTLNGSGADPDGTIVSYAWTKVSGPSVFLLPNASSASSSLSNLVQGTYVFKLTVMDNFGATASDNVTVTVKAPPPAANQPPIARVIADTITLTLPVNSTLLSGNASTDPDGTIIAYQWSQVSGPNNATINDAQLATGKALNLTVGAYVFELKVTDNNGATGTRRMIVMVKTRNGIGEYWNIYPNPTSGSLNLQYFSNVNGRYRITIHDSRRRMVADSYIEKTSVSMTGLYDLSRFRAGVYYIQIQLPDGKLLAKQFIKL